MIKKYTPPSEQELRHYGLVMTAALVVLSLVAAGVGFMWKGQVSWGKVGVLDAVALLVFLLPALVKPAWLAPIHKGWMKFAFMLGWFNSRLILSLMWLLVFTPVALVQRIIRRDALERKWTKETSSYWQSKPTPPPKHFDRQF